MLDVVAQAPMMDDSKEKDKPDCMAVMVSAAMNRNNWRLKLDGCRTQNFEQNPVVLWAHNQDLPPIGQATGLRVQGDQMLCGVTFDSAPFAQDIKRMYQQGVLRAWSVSYQVLQYAPILDADGICQGFDILEWELLELSAVPVGADASALTQALKTAAGDQTLAQFLQTALVRDAGAIPQGGSEPKEVTAAMDEKQIRAEAQKQYAENLKALRQAFPQDEKFVLDCAEQALTPEQAKSKHYDVLVQRVATLSTEKQAMEKRVADLTAENEDLKKKVLAQGQAPAGSGSGATASAKFMERVRQHQKEHKCSFKQALQAVRDSDPEGFRKADAAGEL